MLALASRAFRQDSWRQPAAAAGLGAINGAIVTIFLFAAICVGAHLLGTALVSAGVAGGTVAGPATSHAIDRFLDVVQDEGGG